MTPTRGRSVAASRRGSRPSTRTVPLSAWRKPSQISMVVVLPAPFGPSRANTAPRGAASEIPSTARRAPYDLTRSVISRAATGSGTAPSLGTDRGRAGSAIGARDLSLSPTPAGRSGDAGRACVGVHVLLPGQRLDRFAHR